MSVHHAYNPDPARYSLDKQRREARKRALQEGRHTVIHLHPSTQECNAYGEHEEYGNEEA